MTREPGYTGIGPSLDLQKLSIRSPAIAYGQAVLIRTPLWRTGNCATAWNLSGFLDAVADACSSLELKPALDGDLFLERVEHVIAQAPPAASSLVAAVLHIVGDFSSAEPASVRFFLASNDSAARPLVRLTLGHEEFVRVPSSLARWCDLPSIAAAHQVARSAARSSGFDDALVLTNEGYVRAPAEGVLCLGFTDGGLAVIDSGTPNSANLAAFVAEALKRSGVRSQGGQVFVDCEGAIDYAVLIEEDGRSCTVAAIDARSLSSQTGDRLRANIVHAAQGAFK